MSELSIFANAALVVAHPDDEILWFSGVLETVKDVIICYTGLPGSPAITRARQAVAERYPLENTRWLHLEQPGSFLGANWEHMEFTSSGLPLLNRKDRQVRCDASLDELIQKLEPLLKDVEHVVTHNPWGEYGHEEHLLVRRAIEVLSTRHPFAIWSSNYCSSRSVTHASRYITEPGFAYYTVPTNELLARDIMSLYVDEGCWTWWDEFEWFDEECYARIDSSRLDTASRGRLFPLNYMLCDYFPTYETGRQLRMRKLRRRLSSPVRAIRRSLCGRRLQSPGRKTFESQILPYFAAAPNVQNIVFVGCDWYTQPYVREFRHKRFITLDIDSEKSRFGNAGAHISDSFLNVLAHLQPGTIDAIVMNGVLGWGINEASDVQAAVRVAKELLKPSGLLVVGWNDVGQYRPRLLAERAVEGTFARWDFPPLDTWQYRVPGSQLRQVYDFYRADEAGSR